MKKIILITIIVLNTFLTIAQNLSIDETIKYINDKLSTRDLNEKERKCSISLTNKGEIFVNFDNIQVLKANISEIEVPEALSYTLPKGACFNICFSCKSKSAYQTYNYDTPEEQCLNKCMYLLHSHYYASIDFPNFDKPDRALYICNFPIFFKDNQFSSSENDLSAETLNNAFEHLFNLVLSDPKYSPISNQSNDPFANTNINNDQNSNKITNVSNSNLVQMDLTQGGNYELPVVLNGVLKINFILDSGASEISISPDVASTLIKTGTINDEDWLEDATYKLADGRKSKSKRFIMKEIDIGGYKITNVPVAISKSIDSPNLLGQNVLNKFGKVTIDYDKHTLFIQNK